MLKYAHTTVNLPTAKDIQLDLATGNFVAISEIGLMAVLTRMCLHNSTQATEMGRLCQWECLDDYGHVIIFENQYYIAKDYLKEFPKP